MNISTITSCIECPNCVRTPKDQDIYYCIRIKHDCLVVLGTNSQVTFGVYKDCPLNKEVETMYRPYNLTYDYYFNKDMTMAEATHFVKEHTSEKEYWIMTDKKQYEEWLKKQIF